MHLVDMSESVVKCDLELMEHVRECINSNFSLYEPIVDPVDLSEHHVDREWARKNLEIREFFLLKNAGRGDYVGAASYQNLGEFAYIGYFYIKYGHHRNGHGRYLMEFMENRTREDGIEDLTLFANSRATWALNFYEKVGYSVFLKDKRDILALHDGIMAPFYEENAWFLKKKI